MIISKSNRDREVKSASLLSFDACSTRMVATALFLTTVCLPIGCGRSGPSVEFVEGGISLDGSPLDAATVNFHPLNEAGLPAFGSTDMNGRYRLTSARGGERGKGAQLGEYAVTISKWRNRLEDLPAEPDPGDTAAMAEWMRKKEALERLPPDYIVPKRYGDPKTSGLTATVKQGRNTGAAFVFELTSDSPK